MTSKHFKILILGFGTVGQGFYELFSKKRDSLGLSNVSVSEIVDMKYGHITNPKQGIIKELEGGKTFPQKDVLTAIRESDADIVCEFTWLNLKTAEPAYSHVKTALELGKHVITTNKGPSALKYNELIGLAKKKNVKFLMKGTVMAGTPSFNLLDLLPGAEVISVRGIMNGTTNYILTSMEQGKNFSVALKEAQNLGYAEADPTNDVDGFDTASKITIISHILGWKHEFKDIKIEGIRNVTPEQAREKTKLIAYADKTTAYVKPIKLDRDDILSGVSGVTNAIEINTDTMGKVYSMGPGAGRIQTAQAALTDLVTVVK
ncbi:MAG: homoserine dehydrogenase [Thermoplasmatales archaeon]|jgi:homoserine dehydrogenase|nr:homoserine dehydrogenase [Candidatus Thermoplasmatota archaeon]MDA8054367.1 homoserine dehydrogenase [Thermoplasmatales archaeon]